MKMKTLFTLLTLSSLTLTSCFEQTKTVVVKETSGGGSDSGGGGGWDNGGGNGNGGGTGGSTGTGSTCYGDTSDGTGNGYPLRQYTIFVAGEGESPHAKPENTWKPWGNYDNVGASDLRRQDASKWPTIAEAKSFFQSDSKLNVRFKLQSQPNPPSGQEYCYGRRTGSTADANKYTKVKFKVSLRDVNCTGGDANNCTLGGRYQTKTVGPIAVGACSPILQLGALRNVSAQGTVLEVHEVRTDQTCAFSDSDCEADDFLRTSSCWEATMQFSTDYTQKFR